MRDFTKISAIVDTCSTQVALEINSDKALGNGEIVYRLELDTLLHCLLKTSSRINYLESIRSTLEKLEREEAAS